MFDVPYLFIHDLTMHLIDFKHLKSDLPIGVTNGDITIKMIFII